MRVSMVLAENIRNWGIKHVFGIPGKSIAPLILDLDSKEIEFILSKHESGAGFEAGGYAMMTKSLGVTVVTSGPGGINALASAGQAKEFHLPVLFITGQPSSADMGKALGQDSSSFGADSVKMFEPVTLFSARVEQGNLLPLYLKHALEHALTGAKGPVHLCIPGDILMQDIPPFRIDLPTDIPYLISSNIDQIIPFLESAKKPVLLLGKGVMASEAYEEIRIVAEHWKIPVITTPGGKGAFSSIHPLCLGGFGLGGSKSSIEYLKSGIDLMIVVGTKLSDMSISGFTEDLYPQQVIQFDHDMTYIGKSIPLPTKAILGDIKLNLQALIKSAKASLGNYQMNTVSNDSSHEMWSKEHSSKEFLSAVKAVQTLRSSLPHHAILIGDAGSHSIYAVQNFDVFEPGTFIFDEVFISMGNAIGYAIGAKVAAPNRIIVCLTGDGCMLMHGTEISTAVNHQIPAIFVVLNNGRLDMVDKGMSYNTGRTIGAINKIPLNVAQFARSFGATAFCCRTIEEIKEAIQLSLNETLPSVIEIMVDPDEIPPILSRLLCLNERKL